MEYKIIIDPSYTDRRQARTEAYADAKAKADAATVEVEKAESRLIEIRDAWEVGDDSISAEEYSIAEASLKRNQALASAAQREVPRRPSDGEDLDVAMGIAWAIQGDHLYPSDIIVSDTEPAKPKVGIPYVIGTWTRHLGAGWIAGSAQVIVYGPTRLIASWRGDEIAKYLNGQVGFSGVTASDACAEQVSERLWKASTSISTSFTGYTGCLWSPYPDVSAPTTNRTPSYGYFGIQSELGHLVAKYWGQRIDAMQAYQLGHSLTPIDAQRDGDIVTERYNLALRLTPRSVNNRPYTGMDEVAVLKGAILGIEGRLLPSLGSVHHVRLGGKLPEAWADSKLLHVFTASATITVKHRVSTDADSMAEDQEAEKSIEIERTQSEPVEIEEPEEPETRDRTPDLDPSKKRAA